MAVLAWDVVCDQADETFPLLFRRPPWKLLWNDAVFLGAHLPLLPWIFLPLGATGSDVRIMGIVFQVVTVVLSLGITVGLLLALTIGVPTAGMVLLALVAFIFAVFRLQTGDTRQSVAPPGVTDAPGFEDEAWLFVNGIGTTDEGAQLIVNRLHALFRRPVTAILNRSLGLWFDLVECVLQRDLLLVTQDIRVGYKYVRRAVMNPRKKRVVLIGHSQGGIIVSAWIDQLLCDFATQDLAKVEVYTFASAANHFSAPAHDGKMPFGPVEHFANENDFVARFGVLGNVPPPPKDTAEGDAKGSPPATYGTFGGRIFLRKDTSGHLLNSHYLNPADCILDNETVRKNSHLVSYLDGGNPVH